VPIVTLPDGKEIEFPEGMSASQIQSSLVPGTPAGEMIGNLLDPKSMRAYKEVAAPYVRMVEEIVKDIIPVSSQLRSVDRMNEIMNRDDSKDTPIRRFLNNADIALEGLGLGADFVPGLKAAGIAAGSLIPLMARKGGATLPRVMRSQAGVVGAPNITRLDRAKSQGYDTENIWYHGTSKDFDAFDLSKSGDLTNSPAASRAVFASNDKSKAAEFAELSANEKGGDPKVISMYVRPDKVAKIKWDDHFDIPMRSGNGQRLLAQLVDSLGDQGFDGARILGDDGVKGGVSEILAVTKPEKLRRIDADFNDADFGRNGLLLGAGGSAVIASETLDRRDNPSGVDEL